MQLNGKLKLPNNKIFYLTCLGIIIIFLSKYACADSKSISKSDGSSDGGKGTPFSPSTKVRKTRGKKSPKPRAVRLKFPKVAVFQADGVFWPYRVEKEVVGPFALKRTDVLAQQMEENNMRTPMNTKIVSDYKCKYEITDKKGKLIKAYDGVKDVLEEVKKKKSKLAVIETTANGATTLHLIQLCELDVFKFKEVDDDLEIDHIKSIKTRTEEEFKDMVYFGTNETSLKEIQDLGVLSIKINLGEGLKMYHIEEAEKLYSTRKQ